MDDPYIDNTTEISMNDCDPMTIAGSEARALAAIDAALDSPAAPVAWADSMDGLKLYAELRDLCDEANAVDTIIGRPELFRSKLFALRDRIGAATYTAPAAPVAQPSEADIDAACEYIAGATSRAALRSALSQLRPEVVRELARIGRVPAELAPPAPAPQPVSDPSDEEIARAYTDAFGLAIHDEALAVLLKIARAVLALRPKVQPLTPRGFLLHWPEPGGGRELIWSEKDGAGVMIGCPVEPVYSYGVRAHGIGQGE